MSVIPRISTSKTTKVQRDIQRADCSVVRVIYDGLSYVFFGALRLQETRHATTATLLTSSE